jgi:hypothetical protein
VKIQGSITQVWDTLAIDKKLHPIPLHHGVAVLLVIKRHLVLQTRTAAFCNLNPQTLSGIFRLRSKQGLELPNSVVRDVNHLDRKYGTGLSKSKGRQPGIVAADLWAARVPGIVRSTRRFAERNGDRLCFSSQFVRQKLEFKIA